MHPRDLRSNIWRLLLSATDTEIHEGMHFYYGAYGLCRAISLLSHGTHTPDQVAGIYAALSPMNGWETNVANTLDILRYGDHAQVNTPSPNRRKALRILGGEHPLSVLRGSKVTAFYRAIANPDDSSSIPVDRHLICAALGNKLSKNELSRAASNHPLYLQVESAYRHLGEREGIGNRLASITWFVQRRIIASNQLSVYHPDSPVHCGIPMHHHGRRPPRYRCNRCNYTKPAVPFIKRRLPPPVLLDGDNDQLLAGQSLYYGKGDRPRVHLGKGDLYADTGGGQYLSRFVVMRATGERLRTDEHVHHTNGNILDCRRDNLEVWLAEHHGRYHANHQLLYMVRDKCGRYLESNVPAFDKQYQQIVGNNSSEEVPF